MKCMRKRGQSELHDIKSLSNMNKMLDFTLCAHNGAHSVHTKPSNLKAAAGKTYTVPATQESAPNN
eukprot:607069-Pelagomonas_calceolata.AAC.4